MNADQKRKMRMDMIDNVYNFKHNERVMLGSNIHSWKPLDSGYGQKETMKDYALAEKVVREHIERYDFDMYADLLSRNPFKVMDQMGGGHHFTDEADELVQSHDYPDMLEEEWPEYLADEPRFTWSKSFPRYLTCNDPDFKLTLDELKHLANEEWDEWNAFCAKMDDMCIHEYGALKYYCSFVLMGWEWVIARRGIKGAGIDVRRHKNYVREYVEKLGNTVVEPMLQMALSHEKDGYVAPVTSVLLAHSILNHRQFEELYWPQFKRMIDASIEKGVHVYCFCEADLLRFADMFADIPKGVLLVHPEQDDIYEFRQKLPNIALAGGMSSDLLYFGTEQECRDGAKKLIDTLGEGYVLCQNKMISFREDAKRENLLAVNDFVKSYKY